MAMADRRPLGIPVASAHASPAFNPANTGKTAGSGSPQRRKNVKRTLSDIKGAYALKHLASSGSDQNGDPREAPPKPLTTSKSPNSPKSPRSPTSANISNSPNPSNLPESRSISPDSLMTSGGLEAKKGASSISSRDSTPLLGTSLAGQRQNSSFYDKTSASGSSGTSDILGKKAKAPARVPIATGISTTIPVTGEKPKPQQQDDASLEDDVLFAIFLILYEKDLEGQGMTVKQICDVLIERHPDMAQLLSKTSNLVSAKLNAYVKRVEKGDANLKYALSREWADASPKRMVYVYRGLLAKDFHVHVQKAVGHAKRNLESLGPLDVLEMDRMADLLDLAEMGDMPHAPGLGRGVSLGLAGLAGLAGLSHASDRVPPFAADSFEAVKYLALLKPRRLTMYDLGISRHSFSDLAEAQNLFVPYSSAPVAANMTKPHARRAQGTLAQAGGVNTLENDPEASPTVSLAAEGGPALASAPQKRFSNDSDFDLDDLEVFNDSDDDDADGSVPLHALDALDALDAMANKAKKRSKSMSHLSLNKKAKFVTAAAAAPRVPRTPCSHSPHAAAAAAALHAAALKSIATATAVPPAAKEPSAAHEINSKNPAGGLGASSASSASSGTCSPRSKSNWTHAVRSGFLTQEISAPEDVSLSDLDKLFG